MTWNPIALDLLSKMLALDPRERITAKEALRHEFFKPVSRAQEIQMMTAQRARHPTSKQSGQ